MDLFQQCTICTRTGSSPKEEVILVATFSQNLYAKEALAAIEKAHIIPVRQWILTREEVIEKNNNQFMEAATIILQLHGIKDIVHMEALYMESICQQNGSLTFDSVSAKSWEKYQRLIA